MKEKEKLQKHPYAIKRETFNEFEFFASTQIGSKKCSKEFFDDFVKGHNLNCADIFEDKEIESTEIYYIKC